VSDEELIKETMMLDYSQLVMNNVYCHKEIERLKEDNEYLNKVNIELFAEKNRLHSIIKEDRKLLEKIYKVLPGTYNQLLIEIKQILDKENKW